MYIQKKPEAGYTPYLTLDGENYGTGMDAGLLVLKKGQHYEIWEKEKEAALLLLEGRVEFAWQDKRQEADRPDCFHYDPWCLHLSKGVKGRVTALDLSLIHI